MSPIELLGLFIIAGKVKKDKEPKYNISVYKRGDLLEVPRMLFRHFGIYLGDNKVAHLIPDILPVFSNNGDAIKRTVTNNRLILGVIAKVASVRVDSVEDFAYGAEILVNHTDKLCNRPPFGGDEVARRAERLLGAISYSLLWYNCEHYVMYCRYGTTVSFQTYQFCKKVRKIICSRKTAFITALTGICMMLYLGSMSVYTMLPTVFIPFTIWMAS